MFPTIEFEDENDNLPIGSAMGKVFLFDYSTKQHDMRDGKPVVATYEEAIKQWVTMVLITELGKYKVYSDLDFGLSLIQFIGRKDIPLATITSEVKRQIEEQVTQHPEIVETSNFSLVRQDGKAIITFTVHTVKGSLIEGIESEVTFNG